MKIRKLLAGALLSLVMLPAVLPLSAAADTISIEYPIWVGGKRITDANKDDVLGDGKVKFTAAESNGKLTGTLTLDDPEITGYRNDDAANKSVLEIDFTTDGWSDKAFDLTIEGSANLAAEGARCGIGAWGNQPSRLTIDGDFTVKAGDDGISMLSGDLEIAGGSLTAVGNRGGIYAGASLTIGSGIESVTAANTASWPAIRAGGGITLDDTLLITEPTGGKLSGDRRTIVNGDGNIATAVTIKPRLIEYPIWVGGKRITDQNKGDVLEDGGSVKFEGFRELTGELMGKLTFNDATITGYRTGQSESAVLDIDFNTEGWRDRYFHLVIEGSATISDEEAHHGIGVRNIDSSSYNLPLSCLSVNGDITAKGRFHGIYLRDCDLEIAGGEVTGIAAAEDNFNAFGIKLEEWHRKDTVFRLSGGKVIARGYTGLGCLNARLTGGSLTATGTGTHGIFAYSQLTIGSGISFVRAESGSDESAIHMPEGVEIKLDGSLAIIEPAGGKIDPRGHEIINGDGSPATEATIEPLIEYPIWVGSERITNANRHDVLGDGGKVKFIAAEAEGVLTGTLTLDDPEITAYRTGEDANGAVLEIDFTTDGWSDKGFDLTIEGSAEFAAEGAKYGIGAWSNVPINLTVNGDITARGDDIGIAVMNGGLTVSGGEVTGIAQTNENSYMGIHSQGGSGFRLTGGKVTARSSGVGLSCDTAELSGGSLEAEGDDYGMYARGDIDIGPGIEIIKASGGARAIEIEDTGAITLDGTLVITEPEGGQLSGDCKTIVGEDGKTAAKSAVIEPGSALERTVIWLDGDGSELDRAAWAYGAPEPVTKKIPASPNPGEIFDKWDDGTVNGSVTTYRPIFKGRSAATIRYELNGGTMDGKTGTVTAEVGLGSTITLPAPARDGYSFVNWGDPAWKAGAGFLVEGDHTFTAQWQENGQHTHQLTLVEATEADCTQAGNSAYYTCDSCDLWFEDAAGAVEITDKNSVIIPALGHSWSPWKQTKAPTALKKGVETRVCTRCGEEETRSIPARGFDDDDDDDDDDSGSRTGARGTALESGSWMQTADGWTYQLSAGGLATGWHYIYSGGRSDWYFFDSRGVMQTGWLDWEGSRYYLNPISNGYMGAMQTGWQLIGGRWYYFETVAGQNLGHMYVNRVTPDGYRTGSDGAWDGNPAAGR